MCFVCYYSSSSRINWKRPADAVPAFCIIRIVPFTCSIIWGVGFGYLLFVTVALSDYDTIKLMWTRVSTLRGSRSHSDGVGEREEEEDESGISHIAITPFRTY